MQGSGDLGGIPRLTSVETSSVSELLGHHRAGFTGNVHVHVVPDVAKEAAEARAAVVPGKSKTG